MTPQEKRAFRCAFAKDAKHGWQVAKHEEAAWVAEYRLEVEGVKPELAAYLRGIGETIK